MAFYNNRRQRLDYEVMGAIDLVCRRSWRNWLQAISAGEKFSFTKAPIYAFLSFVPIEGWDHELRVEEGAMLKVNSFDRVFWGEETNLPVCLVVYFIVV